MNGNEINSYLERGFLGSYSIRILHVDNILFLPSDPGFRVGAEDSVTEQAHRIDANWNDDNKTLSLIQDNGGAGYWIPYLQTQQPIGIARTPMRNLGTYTPEIQEGGNISWVVTGPFSGCYSTFFNDENRIRFAHLATPSDGYSADTIDGQNLNIGRVTNLNHHLPQKVISDEGIGYVFWTYLDDHWERRIIYILPNGTVKSVERRTPL